MKFYYTTSVPANNLFILLYILFLVPQLSYSQGGSGSPYARFGIGILSFQGSVKQIGMGKSGIAGYSFDQVNLLNPAALGYDTITTFEAGLNAEMYRLKSSAVSQSGNDVSLNYFSMAFPLVKRNTALGFGILPFSSMDFESSNITSSGACNCGNIKNSYTGDGGVNRFFLSLGYTPFGKKSMQFYSSENYRRWTDLNDSISSENEVKKFRFIEGFSFGLNSSWLFGTLDYSRAVTFIDSTAFIANRKSSGSTLGDFYFEAGIHYHFTNKKGITFATGAVLIPEQKIKTSFNSIWYNFRESGSFENIRDTVEIITDKKSTTIFPTGYSVGIMISKQNKWSFTVDYSARQWNNFLSDIDETRLKNSYSITAGTEFTPNVKSLNYMNKINYRAGFYYHSSYLQLNQTDILDVGISFGLGLPLIKKDRIQRTMIQIGIEAGKAGTTQNNLLEQDYIRFYFGVTLNEFWFFKRKYE